MQGSSGHPSACSSPSMEPSSTLPPGAVPLLYHQHHHAATPQQQQQQLQYPYPSSPVLSPYAAAAYAGLPVPGPDFRRISSAFGKLSHEFSLLGHTMPQMAVASLVGTPQTSPQKGMPPSGVESGVVREALSRADMAQSTASHAAAEAGKAVAMAERTSEAMEGLCSAVERLTVVLEGKLNDVLGALEDIRAAVDDQANSASASGAKADVALQSAIHHARIQARIHNAQQMGTSPLKALPNDEGQVPLSFPQSPQSFGDKLYGGMVEEDYKNLLAFYGLSTEGNLQELRSRLAQYCCVKLTRYGSVSFGSSKG